MHLSSHLKRTIAVCCLLMLVLGLALLGSARLRTFAAGSSKLSHSSVPGAMRQALTCGSGTWNLIPSANVPSSANTLSTVAAISSDNVWAVGYSVNSVPNIATLIENWNGSSWSIVSSPNPGTNSVLKAVATISSDNVWAVGYYNSGKAATDVPLAEQWDGTSWNAVPTASLPSGYAGGFTQIAAIPGTNDLWAVGTSFTTSGTPTFQTLIEQWDGTSWNLMPSPNPTTWGSQTASFLEAVAVHNANDAWAVGEYGDAGLTTQAYPLFEHWNGTNWSIVSPSNNEGLLGVTQLFGVAQIPGTDQFVAVGSNLNGHSTPYTTSMTVVEQWNGTTWNLVSSPNKQSHNNYYSYLNNVVALSATNIWAVGGYDGYKGAGGKYYPSQPLTEHWNGKKWSIASDPGSGSGDNVMNGVTMVPSSTQLWSVGSYTASSGLQTMTELYC